MPNNRLWNDLVPVFLIKKNGVYAISDQAPLLAGMPCPKSSGIWNDLGAAGFESVVCLTRDVPSYDPSPLRLLTAHRFEDLFGGRMPTGPEKEERLLRETVRVVAHELTRKKPVVVHFAGGTGRTGTIIACTLRALGYTIDEVLNAIEAVNILRGQKCRGWPESRWQKAMADNWDAKGTKRNAGK